MNFIQRTAENAFRLCAFPMRREAGADAQSVKFRADPEYRFREIAIQPPALPVIRLIGASPAR